MVATAPRSSSTFKTPTRNRLRPLHRGRRPVPVTKRADLPAFFVIAALACAAPATLLPAPVQGCPVLGRHPLCEASAAAMVPCPKGKGVCLLVGDNEQRRQLFWFRTHQGHPSTETQHDLLLGLEKADEISDIEALATLPDGRVLVMGSHGRNSFCEARKNRRRYGLATIEKGDRARTRPFRTKRLECARLFTEPASRQARVSAACDAIQTAERHATRLEAALERGELDKAAARAECNRILPFNAEGAVALPGAAGTEVWIGLRAPLLAAPAGHPARRDLAMLLRLKNLDAWVFDRVAFLDLDGRGVRDLAWDGAQVWVIAGPPEDRRAPFQLRRFAIGALEDDQAEAIATELVEVLPPSAEGLAIEAQRAYVVIDGDAGDDDDACGKPSAILEIDLPGSE